MPQSCYPETGASGYRSNKPEAECDLAPGPCPTKEQKALQCIHMFTLLPGTSFLLLQGLLARVLGLWLIDLLEHHKIDPMFYVYQLILNK